MNRTAISIEPFMTEQQNREINKTVARLRGRLFSFIRKRVRNTSEAEDILQDVMYQLVEAYRLMKPVEQWTAWLYRVARNKITDRYRKKKEERLDADVRIHEDGEPLFLSDLIASHDTSSPEQYMNAVIMEEISQALDELPDEQREVFIAHEIDGKSFNEMSEAWKIPVNTLLARKRYAVLYLRKRLQKMYDELFNQN